MSRNIIILRWQGEYRPLPARLISRAIRKLHLAPTALPLPALAIQLAPVAPGDLVSALARLGYEELAHLSKRAKACNSAFLVVLTLVHPDLELRIVETLPWMLSTFYDLDWIWLIAQCRLLNIQNRLGYLVVLARQLGNCTADVNLKNALFNLEESRLVGEGTLCCESMPTAERDWMRRQRSSEASQWSMLTSLTADQLSFAA